MNKFAMIGIEIKKYSSVSQNFEFFDNVISGRSISLTSERIPSFKKRFNVSEMTKLSMNQIENDSVIWLKKSLQPATELPSPTELAYSSHAMFEIDISRIVRKKQTNCMLWKLRIGLLLQKKPIKEEKTDIKLTIALIINEYKGSFLN